MEKLAAKVGMGLGMDPLPDPLPPRLMEFARKPVRNTRNEIVGEVRPLA